MDFARFGWTEKDIKQGIFLNLPRDRVFIGRGGMLVWRKRQEYYWISIYLFILLLLRIQIIPCYLECYILQNCPLPCSPR